VFDPSLGQYLEETEGGLRVLSVSGLASPRFADLAMRAAKEAVDHGLDVDLTTGLEIERLQFAALFATRDREIGMTSFVEQGPGKAVFEGR